MGEARHLPSPPNGGWLRAQFRESQHRDGFYLVLSNIVGALAGLGFWLLVARVAGLEAAQIGVGYAIVAVGSAVAIVAKGGLDSALLRDVPRAGRSDGVPLLVFAVLVGASIALLLALGLALFSLFGPGVPHFSPTEWALVTLLACLLVSTWLQDAYLLGAAHAGFVFRRNAVFSAARLALPVPLVLLAIPNPVAVAWLLALFISALSVLAMRAGRSAASGVRVPRTQFLANAARNLTGGAAEVLPGLLLVPLVLLVDGAEAAGFFGIAWALASLLFMVSASISRSALAQLVRHPGLPERAAVMRAATAHLAIVFPGALALAVLAPYILAAFGPEYAVQGRDAVVLFCVSVVFVAPSYLYFAVLRARAKSLALVLFPAAMIVALFGLAPPLAVQFGVTGVALAWLVANAPFGLFAAWRLTVVNPKGVNYHREAATLPHPAHLE